MKKILITAGGIFVRGIVAGALATYTYYIVKDMLVMIFKND